MTSSDHDNKNKSISSDGDVFEWHEEEVNDFEETDKTMRPDARFPKG